MDPLRWLRRSIWVYLLLLLFEGVLRKWVLPQYANPLLIIRDPVVILIYVLALRASKFPHSLMLIALYAIAALSLLVSLMFGSASLVVNVFGLRTNFLHLPLIFLIGNTLRLQDVLSMGRVFLVASPLIAVLMVLQFQSPPDARLNRGTIGDGEAGQLEVAFGRIRPAAVFSYNTGAGQFLTVTLAFLLAGATKRLYPPPLLVVAAGSILLAMIVSGSRTTVLSCGLVIAAFLGTISLRPQQIIRGLFVGVAVIGMGVVLARTELGGIGFETLSARFTGAREAEGHFLGRVWRDFADPFQSLTLFGVGLGLGTNVGARLATGTIQYLVAEGEWGRILGESGIVAGLAYLVWRMGVALQLLAASIRAGRTGHPLPLLLLSCAGILMINGQFGQTTTLGFAVLGMGLTLAALKGEPPADGPAVASPPMLKAVRGRSVIAEALHGN